MNIGQIDRNDLDEFEKLGLKYANLQLKMSAILRDYVFEASLYSDTEIYEIAMAQDELHTRRMELIRHPAD